MNDSTRHPHEHAPLAIIVNGPSSSGKSTLCKALIDRLTDLADGEPEAAFARVAFDDLAVLMCDKLFPISYVKVQGGDLTRLASRSPHDGRAGWEYVDESHAPGRHGGSPRLRIVFNPHVRRLLSGLQRSWGAHLKLGTNLIIDHFIQDADWCQELLDVLRESDARVFLIRVECDLAELERRESFRGDGKLEGRPLGLARRSDELCHGHALPYNITVHTDRQTTEQSVAAIIAALLSSGLMPRSAGTSPR
jgi:chloramphenicol 3-O phosphotransferase